MRVGIYGKQDFPELKAIADGLGVLGHRAIWRRHSVFTPDQVEDFDCVVTHGTRLHSGVVRDCYRERRVPVLVADLPAIRVDGYYALWPFEVNSIPTHPCAHDRLQMVDWRPAPMGSRALICGQKEGDAAHLRDAEALKRWYARAAEVLCALGWPVSFRPHPQTNWRPSGFQLSERESFEAELDSGEWGLVVTINSTCGLKALARQIPVMCDPSSFYAELAGDPRRAREAAPLPDRSQLLDFFARVSYSQWTPEELASGVPVEFTLRRALSMLPLLSEPASGAVAPPLGFSEALAVAA